MHTKGRQRRGSAVCQLSMGKKKGNTFWVTRGVRWKQWQDRIDGLGEPRRGRLSQVPSSHSCSFFLSVKTIFANVNNSLPKLDNHRVEAPWCHQHVRPGAHCTALTHVQAFMTFWASFYSFITTWTRNMYQCLLKIPLSRDNPIFAVQIEVFQGWRQTDPSREIQTWLNGLK